MPDAEKDTRLDAASMEDFRAVAVEAVALRKGIEALADKYGSVDYSFSGRSVSQSLRTLLTTVLPPGLSPHDKRGRLDRSICGGCNDAYVECSKCGVYLCECTRSETCPIPPGSSDA